MPAHAEGRPKSDLVLRNRQRSDSLLKLNMIKKCIEFFYGRECPDCLAVIPMVKQLIAKEGVEFVKREVWHDAENHQRMEYMR